MEYKGKLYCKVGTIYFFTGKDSEDWDRMESDNKEMRQLLTDIVREFEPMKILNGLKKAEMINKADQFLKRRKHD